MAKTKYNPPAPRLGLDFGKVIVGGEGVPGNEDTPFLGASVESCLECPPMPGAIQGVKELALRFAGRVWIVSKAGPTMQRKTLRWLAHHNFWRVTGIEPYSISFTLTRDDKRPVCQRLKLTHFVDDHADVLENLAGVVSHRYQFGGLEPPSEDPEIMQIPDWATLLQRLTPRP